MTLIYRLQDEKGRGVFQGYALNHLDERQRDRAYGHPGPHCQREAQDGRYPLAEACRDEGMYFGFSTLSQARSWFGKPALRAVGEAGVKLVVYRAEDCPRVVRGNFQCVFQRPSEPAAELPAEALYWTSEQIERAVHA